MDMKADRRRIRVGPSRIRHRDDAGVKLRAAIRHRLVKIVSECCDPAATRKVIANKCDALE
jgi:hypothetical protein